MSFGTRGENIVNMRDLDGIVRGLTREAHAGDDLRLGDKPVNIRRIEERAVHRVDTGFRGGHDDPTAHVTQQIHCKVGPNLPAKIGITEKQCRYLRGGLGDRTRILQALFDPRLKRSARGLGDLVQVSLRPTGLLPRS